MMKVIREISKSKKEKLKGISGWLLVPFFELLFSSFLFLILFIIEITQLFIEKDFIIFTLLMFPILISGSFSSYLLILMIKQDKKFPAIMIVFLSLSIFLNIWIILQTLNLISLPFLIFQIIWIIYFIISKRVKNTFVY